MLLAVFGALLVAGVLAWLGLVVLRTWRTVRTVGRDVSSAGERVALATAELEAVMALQQNRPGPREERFDW